MRTLILLKLRGGFSFYEAGYTEIQPWLILKTKNINNLNNEIKYTPTLRLINKSIFIDAGVSTWMEMQPFISCTHFRRIINEENDITDGHNILKWTKLWVDPKN